ncbi:MAG: hypothetical protein HYT31_04420 [Parcubacteria group bacterium]|nr:hypothetical protein [Parcubacteria group bacterium]
MAGEYQGPLTVALLEKSDDEIAQIIAGLPGDAEIVATPLMDELIYRRKDYSRGIDICERAISSGAASPLRVAQLQIAIANLKRRRPEAAGRELEIQWWMRQAAALFGPMDMNAPGVRRTVIMWHYNHALLCRLAGDFEGEAEHHRAIGNIAEDEFSRNNAAYMAEFAMMLHYVKEGTATDEMWHDFLDAGDAYRATLDSNVPREAQWMANEWGHRIQVVILFGERLDTDLVFNWLDDGYSELDDLLERGVPGSARFALRLMTALTLLCDAHERMALREAESVMSDEKAGNDWRMLAALLKARIIGGIAASVCYEEVVQMPGDGICHAARAVAERMLTSGPV